MEKDRCRVLNYKHKSVTFFGKYSMVTAISALNINIGLYSDGQLFWLRAPTGPDSLGELRDSA